MEGIHLSSPPLLLMLVACLFVVHTVCAQDAEPPNVLSFDFDPKAIDTSAASQVVTFTTRLADDLSGVTDGDIGGMGVSPSQARFQSPSGNQISDVGFVPRNLISGDEFDGIYRSTMTLPRYSEQGTWKLQHFLLVDDVGNSRRLSQNDMDNLGFPTEFEVVSVGDTKPPDVLSFDFDPKAIDTSAASQVVTFTTRLADDLSGVTDGDIGGMGVSPSQARFQSPSGNQISDVGFVPRNLISGDEFDGIYRSTMTLPRYSEQGTWKLQHFLLVDDVGNSRRLSQNDMDNLGFPTEFEVVSVGDTKPPDVLSFDFDPKAIDTSAASQVVTFTTRLADDLSGVTDGDIGGMGVSPSQARFQSPSGNQISDVGFVPRNLISGDEFDGIYRSTMTLPRYSEQGTWKLQHFLLVDDVGNSRRLSQNDMDNLGFPTMFRNGHSGAFSISGMKFNDLNNNGARDAGEPGLPGWKIELLLEGDVIDSFETLSDGTYSFDYLAPGSYTVREVQQAGWIQTYPPGGSHSINLVNADSTGNNFGNFQNSIVGLSIEKTASSSHVSPGDLLNYTITYTNTGDVRLTEVVLTERYPEGVEFVSALPAPDPGTNKRWTIGGLTVDGTGKIIVTVRVSNLQDLEFASEGWITGEGFVNARESLSTSRGPLDLKNVVTITSAETGPVSAAVTVTVGDPGTEIEVREHGSGSYENEERVHVRTENKSISMDKDMAATYSPTSLGLYRGRTVDYSSRWTEEANAKNRVTGTSMSEQYRYATFIDRESSFFLDENESVMNIDSEFDGMGHIGFLKMPSNTSTAYDTPTIEVREDYVGSFKILQRVDEYGSSVSYEKAASGSGFAVGDRRVKDSQRSYESGTGEYDSEEIIETSTNYIAKDISLVSGPMNQSLTEDVSISASQKWKEGMYSTTPKVSYIGEEFTNLDYLDKETIAKGLNEMNTQASFEGRARFRALLEPNKGNPEVDMDEQYEGDYSIERKVHFTGIAKYDRPHLNLTKTLDGIVEETLPWEYGEPHLEGAVKKRKVATYTITVENDGNAAFDKVYVKDTFPPGASFIEPSSLRPKVITDTYANWTLQNLPIGSALNITLKLDVTKYAPVELVNRVDACGVYDDETVCARNFSALEINWLTCCIVPREEQLSVVKTAEVDETNSSVVRYKIEITNWEDATRVATVTDRLPAGMKLIESSIPFATYEDGVVVWNLIEIPASGTAAIEFSVLAPGDGRYTNIVEVDPRSVDRPVVQPVRATCVIDVGIVEDECGAVSCDSWQPPNWEFEHTGYGQDQTTCEDLTCAICDGTDFCLAP